MTDEQINQPHPHILDNGYLLYNTIYQNHLHEQDILYTWASNDNISAGIYQEKNTSNLILEVYHNEYDSKKESVTLHLKNKIRLSTEYFAPQTYVSSSSLEFLVKPTLNELPSSSPSFTQTQFSLRFVCEKMIIVSNEAKSIIIDYTNGQFRPFTSPIKKGSKLNKFNILFSYDEKYIVQLNEKPKEDNLSFKNINTYPNNTIENQDTYPNRNQTDNLTEENKETYATTISTTRDNNPMIKNTLGTIDTDSNKLGVKKSSTSTETKTKVLTRTYLFIPVNNAIYYAIIKDCNIQNWNQQFTFYLTIIKINEEETIKDLKITRIFESKDSWYYLFLVLTNKTYYEIVSDWCDYSLRSIIINNTRNYNKLKYLQYSFASFSIDYFKIIIDYKKDALSYIYLFLDAKVFKFDFDWMNKVDNINDKIQQRKSLLHLDEEECDEYCFFELTEVKGQFDEVCVWNENIIVYNKKTHRLFFFFSNNTEWSQSSDKFVFVKFVSFSRSAKMFFVTHDSINKIIFHSNISNYPNYWIDNTLGTEETNKGLESQGEKKGTLINHSCTIDKIESASIVKSKSLESVSNEEDQEEKNDSSFQQTPNEEKIIIRKDLYDIVNTIKTNYAKKSPYDSLCQYCNSDSNKAIQCKECRSSYCSYEHFRLDAKYHFFHCKLKSFFQYYHYQNRKVFYKELLQLFTDIITHLFNNIESKEDYKIYIPLIKLLTELLRILNVKQIEDTLFDLEKTERNYAQEILFFYYNLILLYLNYGIKSDMFTFVNKEIEKAIEKKWFYSQKNGFIANSKPDFLINRNKSEQNSYIKKRFDRSHMFTNTNINTPSDKELILPEVDVFVSHMIHVYSNLINIVRRIRLQLPSALSTVLSDIIKTFSDVMEERPFDSRDNMVLIYYYLLIAPYLCSIKKSYAAERGLKKAVASLSDLDVSPLNVVLLFNLGLVQFTNGSFNEGIHQMESAYRLICLNNYSFHMKINVVEKLALAYLNIRELMKAFLLLKEALELRSSINTPENSMKVIRLKTIINYIKDFVEYEFKVCHIGDIKKEKGLIGREYQQYLIDYVLGMHDKRKKSLFDFYSEDYFKATEFFHYLHKDILMKINNDNQLKKIDSGVFKEEHNAYEKSLNQSAFNDLSTIVIPQNNEKEKEEDQIEYEEEIDIKENVFDQICRQDQLKLTEISADFVSRSIILRDCYGPIDHFNINYDPNYTKEFRSIVEEGKHHFFIKEFTYSKTSRLDNYFSNKDQNYLDGLSKYLLQDEIQTMFLVEQSRIYSSVTKTNKVLCNRNENKKNKDKETSNDTLSETELNQEIKVNRVKWVQEIKEKILKNKDICMNNIEKALFDLFDILNEEYLEQIKETPEMILNYIFCDGEARENSIRNTIGSIEE